MAIISLDDFLYIAEKLRREPEFASKIWRRVFTWNELQRVKDTYTDTDKMPADYWWDIPAIKPRWNYLVSGDPAVDHCEYITRKYLSQTSNLTALSVGCGLGQRELRWAEMGVFRRITGHDVSETSVRYANEMAKQKHWRPTGMGKKRLEVFSGPATRQVNEKPKTSNRVQVQYCPSALQPYSQPLGAQVGSGDWSR